MVRAQTFAGVRRDIRPAHIASKCASTTVAMGRRSAQTNVRVEQRPNQPPVIACAADHSTITAGDPVIITATATDRGQ